jgi:hypothetical protein
MQTAPAAPNLPPEDPADLRYEQTTAAAREEAYAAASEHRWNDKTLQPWSQERESLLVRLVEADVPASDLEQIPLVRARLQSRLDALRAAGQPAPEMTVEEVLDVQLYLPTAAKLLYLASHEPQQFDHLRGRDAGRFLRAVESWAAEAIQPGQEWPAVLLALEIRTAHHRVRALRRPMAGTGGGDSGN